MNKNQDYIKFLPKQLINQIAAGEVIDRPASVVRELLENSIDANSNQIDIYIKNYGNSLIQVVDNGYGMSYNDAKNSFKQHTTSKIRTHQDILKITTKGFRGEALAAISAIGQLEIQTTNNNNFLGLEIIIENGIIQKENTISMLKGTRVSVKNIFYNTPARKKFLKSHSIEFNHIIYELYKIVIAHRNITYRFYHNDHILLCFKNNISLKERIEEIFYKKTYKLIPINIKNNNIFINGFISIPNLSKIKGHQFLFVNNRCINNIFLHKIIISAYKGIIKNFRSISYFIFIYTNPILINCNIHPSKKEVALEELHIISNLINNKMKQLLYHKYIINKEQKDKFEKSENCHSMYYKEKIFFTSLKKLSDTEKIIHLQNCIHNVDILDKYWINNINIMKQVSNYVLNYTINTFQINDKYVIFSWQNKYLIFVDQHKAHQNILFEFFSSKQKNNFISQTFLFPIQINLLKQEYISLSNIYHELMEIGFHLYFLNNSAYFYAIPYKIHQNMIINIFKKILTYSFQKGNKNNKNMIIKYISKFAAIQYGTLLNSYQMKSLIKDFFTCQNIIKSNYPIFFILKKNILQQTII
ncbi:DNA mismatch repair endonuclease MutL [Blattabacterium cuenoti]|uniref:DNA mismatch repair endonuclease MutL n=1 Tax=Blattabacterium cuenoti TaxID=1653831 RepID=UPI00163BE2E2|nr:DNA mismatch repair endonuclease MutL [Blattabacterium cuenoti]